jgi:hypothetical protein
MKILHAIWTVYSIASVLFTTIFLWGLIRNIRKELGMVNQAKELAKTTKLVYVEQANGVFQMYDKITHAYVCQAESELELWKIARERFPDKQLVTIAEDREPKII